MIYLIPTVLEEHALETIPGYILNAIKECKVIFAENERTTRRFFKLLWKEIIIDDYEWYPIHNIEEAQIDLFRQKISEGKNIAIISEAGCPGIADPGQALVRVAQQLNIRVHPLVGPNSILLALMGSGMNGQRFHFVGYLPIDIQPRTAKIKELEEESANKKCTQIFIETPYRNNQLIETILKTCKPATNFCIACDLTSPKEFLKTRTISDWKKEELNFHKRPAIFLLMA